MKENFVELIKYFDSLEDFKIPNYDSLPTINLYMEQVVGYIGEILSPFYYDKSCSIITPYMVNNYVKAKILLPPKDKKYDKNHLGYLIFISLLKNSVNLTNLAALIELDNKITKHEKSDLYTLFMNIHDGELKEILNKVMDEVKDMTAKYDASDSEEKDTKFNVEMANLALRLYVSSEINKQLADSLMYVINSEVLPQKAIKNRDIENKIENIKIKKEADKLKGR